MTKNNYITPMIAREVIYVLYPGFELLDLSGPMSVFSAANSLSGKTLYAQHSVSVEGGLVTAESGLAVQSESCGSTKATPLSTLLVVGAQLVPLRDAMMNERLLGWLSNTAGICERFGSVCSGTFVLQAAKLLNGLTVTTHWAGCETLGQMGPDVKVLDDALYHIDGACWTSAGVTTGIDMALEMLRRDHGEPLMREVAKNLVVYAHRPGKQSQFSQLLELSDGQDDDFASLINWLKDQIRRPVKVSEMADHLCMSERSFQRRFTARHRISPARYFERMRMEFARDYLLPQYSVEQAARALGYRSVAAFRTGFQKHFGLSPSMSQRVR